MASKPIPHPFKPERKSALLKAVTPTTIGTISAAAFALYPKLSDGFKIPGAIQRLPGSSILDRIPPKAYAALAGFLLGYTSTNTINWVRWSALRSLFTYTDWVLNARSFKTKLWALMIKLLRGPGPYATFEFQSLLPKQPLPNLNDTLDRWLQVSRQFLSPEEFELTKEAVDEFRVNEGPRLQAYLAEKAKKEDNWVSDYWVNVAYLASREPLAINNNYYATNSIKDKRAKDSLSRAAVTVYLHLQFHDQLSQDIVKPVCLNDIVPLCMHGYRHVYNSVRVPGEHMDTIQRYPMSRHIVVIRKGHYFKLNTQVPCGNRRMATMTPHEILAQLEKIVQIADSLPEESPVAALTTQKRNVWAKHREVLMKSNEETLHAVESAMFILSIDDYTPKDTSDHAYRVMTGCGNDRWFDKCFTSVVSPGAELIGFNVEHTVIDAMVFATVTEHAFLLEKEFYENGSIKGGNTPLRSLAEPIRLEWALDDLKPQIESADLAFKQVREDLDLNISNTPYGKGYMKKCRLSPDGYIQMALQLAYYRMHKEIPKTYEPSTSRMFLLGRTETVHPASTHSVAWVKAMDDPTSMPQSRRDLLKKAVVHQGNFRLDATIGRGCDRHLLALFCASRELGMDIPKLFMDKAWRSDFKLSTSQTPTRLWEYGTSLRFEGCSGGFGPSCHDGYGVSYIIYGDDIINLNVTSWRSCPETDSTKFGQTVAKAFEDMKEMFS